MKKKKKNRWILTREYEHNRHVTVDSTTAQTTTTMSSSEIAEEKACLLFPPGGGFEVVERFCFCGKDENFCTFFFLVLMIPDSFSRASLKNRLFIHTYFTFFLANTNANTRAHTHTHTHREREREREKQRKRENQSRALSVAR